MYKTKCGVVVEMKMRSATGDYMYMWAVIPPQGIQDAKCMMVERQYALKPGIAAKELLAALPKCKPESETLIQESEVKDVYVFKDVKLKGLPKFEWNQLFNLVQNDEK